MILLLTLAGKYQRFVDEGYKTPKYLLPWGDRVILWTIIHELKASGFFSDIYLIGNNRDERFMPHVKTIMQYQGISSDNLFLIDDTKGQAETAMIGLDMIGTIKNYLPVAIHNVDTILYNRDLTLVMDAISGADGFIDVFSSNNKSYSFVLAEGNKVIEIAEKIVISDMATSGFYGFADGDTYRKNYSPDDIYISSIYKRMITKGDKVVVGQKYKEADTIVLGTPSEYFNASLVNL